MNLTKSDLRKQYRCIRNEFSVSQRNMESKVICRKILNSEMYQNAEAVFCYVSFGSEFETASIIEAAFVDNKIIAVPKIIGNEMIFCSVYPDTEFVPNRYGIMEPVGADELSPEDFSCVLLILPGLCFDDENGRIGYGGGFYDRYVAKYKYNTDFFVVSPALSCQYCGVRIPMEEHDVRPDIVIFP